ncbi:MarR family transcriptional regulator [Pseudaeromonas paramecii]|uniref:MarR family transcriptional regulator n=1 Tax=Pseudaeromonas paramecii TaxID=2138166 RepID=A0ABP8QBC2_9GAMM
MDHVDQILAQWARERPDLDCSPMAVWGRLSRMAALAERAIEQPFKALGLSRTDFDVLATLRRAGRPLTPTELYQSAMLSSGAMTARLDKLEAQGWVQRSPSSQDRRSLVVSLTVEGRRLADEAVTRHVANEQQLLAPLSPEEQQQLAGLLRRWLQAHE